MEGLLSTGITPSSFLIVLSILSYNIIQESGTTIFPGGQLSCLTACPAPQAGKSLGWLCTFAFLGVNIWALYGMSGLQVICFFLL